MTALPAPTTYHLPPWTLDALSGLSLPVRRLSVPWMPGLFASGAGADTGRWDTARCGLRAQRGRPRACAWAEIPWAHRLRRSGGGGGRPEGATSPRGACAASLVPSNPLRRRPGAGRSAFVSPAPWMFRSSTYSRPRFMPGGEQVATTTGPHLRSRRAGWTRAGSCWSTTSSPQAPRFALRRGL